MSAGRYRNSGLPSQRTVFPAAAAVIGQYAADKGYTHPNSSQLAQGNERKDI